MDRNLEAVSKLTKLAETYYQQGKFVEAIATYRQVLEAQPDFAPAYHMMGNIWLGQGQINLATQAYYQALELNPNLAATIANLGNILYQQGNFQEAIAHYNKAIAINPNLADVYWNLAKALHRQGRQQQAIVCQEVALELKPSLAGPEVHQQLGNLLAEQGQLDGAIRSYQRALQMTPNAAEIHLNLGVLWKKQNNLTAAVASYQQAIALNPTLFEAYFNLGNALEQLGDNPQAIAAYLQALQTKPNVLSGYYKIAGCLKKMGRYDEAEICYDSQLPPNLFPEFLPNSPPVDRRSLFDRDSDIEVTPIYGETEIPLQPAIAFHHPIHSEFNLPTYRFKPAFIASLSNARVWADSENIAVIHSHDRLIPELSQGSPELMLTSQTLPPPISIDGTVVFLSVRDGHNYFHWMFDLLPRLHLLQVSGIDFNAVDRWIVNSYQTNFQRETLQLLGIPETKLIQSDRTPHIQAKTVFVPSLHRQSDRITNWGGNFLRRQFLVPSLIRSPDRRLYISRKSAQYRRVLNESEVIDCLQLYGFKTVTLETLSFREQVALMANASAIVAPHGAGLTNLVFSPPGSTVIELFSPDYLYNLYWLISHFTQLNYYYLVGDSLERYYSASPQAKPQYIHPAGEDILVNLDRLRSLLSHASIH